MLSILAIAALGQSVTPQTSTSSTAESLTPATTDQSLEVDGTAIGAREVDNRLTVPVYLDGRGPFRFVVDTGADRSVVGTELSRRLDLPAGGVIRLHGVAGTTQVDTVGVRRLDLGYGGVDGLNAPVLPEAFIGAQGIVGIDALADEKLLMDFEHRSMAMQSPRTREADSSGDVVVVARRRHGQLLLTGASAGGVPLDAVIDSGAEITLGNMAFAARLPRRVLASAVMSSVTAVTGRTLTVRIVYVPELVVGGLRVSNLRVALSDAPPFEMFGLDRRPALLLGSDVLRGFRRVALDFRRRRVRFTLWPNGRPR